MVGFYFYITIHELVYVFEFFVYQTMQKKLCGLKTIVPNFDLSKYFIEIAVVNVLDDYWPYCQMAVIYTLRI